jgi:hypothetical protein
MARLTDFRRQHSPTRRWSHGQGRWEIEGLSSDRWSSPATTHAEIRLGAHHHPTDLELEAVLEPLRSVANLGPPRPATDLGPPEPAVDPVPLWRTSGRRSRGRRRCSHQRCERTATSKPGRRTWAGTVSTRRTPQTGSSHATGKKEKRTKRFLHNRWHCG